MYCSVCKQNHDGSACPMHYDQDMPIYNEAMDVEEQLKYKIATLEAVVKEKDEKIRAYRLEFKKIGSALKLSPGSDLPQDIIPKIAALTAENERLRCEAQAALEGEKEANHEST